MTQSLHLALERAGEIILGKSDQLRLAVACLLARGHLLIEDVPGVGKTTLAQTLGRILGLDYSRVQFTSDLLPADILGVSIFDRDHNRFEFRRGPVFTQLLLADEINRASPKTQSALLEAMEERQVTADGTAMTLPAPFFVIATQNPQDQIGTFPLPESQLDRFLMRIEIGYPPAAAERTLLRERERRDLLAEIDAALTPAQVLDLQQEAARVHCSDALIDYLLALVQHTRERGQLRQGLSPRAGLALRRAAQAWALLDGRHNTLPEDVQAVFSAVVSHRLQGTGDGEARLPADTLARELLSEVAVP